MRIQADELISKVAGVFEKMGSARDEAALVAESLVQANLKGHDSHGVGLVATYVRHFENGLLKPNTAADLVKDDGAILMFDGGRGFGRRVGGEAPVHQRRRGAEEARDRGGRKGSPAAEGLECWCRREE